MVDTIIILAITAPIQLEVPEYTAADKFLDELKREEAVLYQLKEELAVIVKEETEIYLTSIVYRISAYQKQIKTYNAVPRTTQHNYKRDFKSPELKSVIFVLM